MESNKDSTNQLLEQIRMELVSIIDDKSIEKKTQIDEKRKSNVPRTSNEISSIVAGNELKRNMCDYHSLDSDIEKMRVHLTESYELFQTIGDRLENINFASLMNRIKDINLLDNKTDDVIRTINELKSTFDKSFMEDRIADMTKDVKSKFSKRTDEFANIPELSEYFRVCSQLQRGLDRLKKQRIDIHDISKRMMYATNNSYIRINGIQDMLKYPQKNGTPTDKITNNDKNSVVDNEYSGDGKHNI